MKKHIQNLIVLLVAIITVGIFFIFGKENMSVGIGTIIILSTFFGEDYTVNPMRYALGFSIFNMLIGIGAFLGNRNIYALGIITFVIAFFTYYIFTYDNRPSKAMGFISMYILLIYSPITVEELPLRLMALILSGIILMILYMLVLKSDFNTIVNKKIDVVVIDLITVLKKEEWDSPIIEELGKHIKDIEHRIYNRIEKINESKDNIERKQIILIFLKRFVYLLTKINKDDKELLNKSRDLLDSISKYNKEEINLSRLNELINELDYIIKTNENDKYAYINYKFKINLSELKKTLVLIEKGDFSFSVSKRKLVNILKNQLKKFNLNYRPSFKVTSLRFNYAIKGAVLMTLAFVIEKYFHIYEGQWLLFTIAVLFLPYAEQGIKKSKDRIVGTVVGAVLFNIAFFFLLDYKVIILILILISVYMTILIKSYNKKVIFITFTALTSTALGDANRAYYIFSEYRFLLVLLGAIITVLVINYIFPYRLRDSTINLLNKYKELNKDILNVLQSGESIKYKREKIMSLLVINKYLWRLISYNNTVLKEKDIEETLEVQNEFLANVNFIFSDSDYEEYNALIRRYFNKYKDKNSKEIKNEAKKDFKDALSSLEKIIIIKTYSVYEVEEKM